MTRKTGCTNKYSIRIILFGMLQYFSAMASNYRKTGLRLDDSIMHFEPLHYDRNNLRSNRIKRDTGNTISETGFKPVISMNFTAHNRVFHVELRSLPNTIFHPDVTFENTLGTIPFDVRNIYSGYLNDIPSSEVYGLITTDGLLDAHIFTPTEDYYIEPASRYMSSNTTFHSVIYKLSDIKPLRESSYFDIKNDPFKCASQELHLRQMKKRSAKNSQMEHENDDDADDNDNDDDLFNNFDLQTNSSHIYDSQLDNETFEIENEDSGIDQPFENLNKNQISDNDTVILGPPMASKKLVTTFEVINFEDAPESIRSLFIKQAAEKKQRLINIDKKKTTCMLYLQADHLLYEKLGSEEATIELMTRHVQRVNGIFKVIDFDGDGKPDNISFMIKRIKVHTSDAINDPTYRFLGNYGVEKYLEKFSEEDYNAFCLAYMFTYRDFEGGTLGLAWTGSLKNAGGVCEKHGKYRGSNKSLNTGIVTLLNYGKPVSPAVSHVTMAHEMGHNFGSQHDPENNKNCVPGGKDGNFIMFAKSTSGDKKNNRKFSPCSLKNVKEVLFAKAIADKGCFIEPKMALCGNGVVENGEECDCGWAEDCEHQCCWPQVSKPVKGQTPCTLRPNKVCDPSQGPCCSENCEYKTGDKCRNDNGCRAPSYCDGTSSDCPNSVLKPNKTVCHKEFVCYKGECTGSICLAYGMESCQCTQGPGDAKTKACELCCKEPGDDKPCRSSFELKDPPFDVPAMFANPGTPCNNYAGYCDVFSLCREIDPNGPLATIGHFLLSEESLQNLLRFLSTYWYSIIFLAIAVLILMGIIIKLFGKKTPLVRRRRRHRTVRHDHKKSVDLEIGGNLNSGGKVIETTPITSDTVEANVPFVSNSKSSRHSKSGHKSSHRRHRKRSSTSNKNKDRQNNLANSLNKLIVNLPSETDTEVVQSSPSKTKLYDNKKKLKEINGGTPNNRKYVARNPRSQEKRLSNVKSKHQHRHKSLSPDKKWVKRLSGSISSLSRSFEMLDLIGSNKDKQRYIGYMNEANNKEKENVNSNKRKPSTVHVHGITLGRFKFNVEVSDRVKPKSSKTGVTSDNLHEKDRKKKKRRRRSIVVCEQVDKSNGMSVDLQRKKYTSRRSVSTGDKPLGNDLNETIIISKKRKPDRPLRPINRDRKNNLISRNKTRENVTIVCPDVESSKIYDGDDKKKLNKKQNSSFVAEESVRNASNCSRLTNVDSKSASFELIRDDSFQKSENEKHQQIATKLGVVDGSSVKLSVLETPPNEHMVLSNEVQIPIFLKTPSTASSSDSDSILSMDSKTRLSPVTLIQSLSGESSSEGVSGRLIQLSASDSDLDFNTDSKNHSFKMKLKGSIGNAAISRQKIVQAACSAQQTSKIDDEKLEIASCNNVHTEPEVSSLRSAPSNESKVITLSQSGFSSSSNNLCLPTAKDNL